ncbi:monocarboxylate transporter 3-like [Clytia hemisphaerica]|uniref:Major facilitator superfamily (MFS) profile domain-containing protein n=1 Tax=Clytia hemisphaerica TaxID=252671 RepID=A0A7M5VGP1_9CNID|eukprot:TCONS_00052086-protein
MVFKFKEPIVDKGLCWLMLAMVFTIYFVLIGTFFSYGVWLPRVMEEFNCNQEQAAWVASIATGLLVLLALPSDLACHYFGVFNMSICGSLLCGIGMIISSYLQNIYHLYLSFGVLMGIGSSLLYTPTLVMMGRWFHKYQALSTTIVMVGAPSGSLVFNIITEKIMQNFKLRSVMVVYGICLMCITLVCSFGYMPFSPTFIEKRSNIENKEEAKGQDSLEIGSGFEFRASLLKNEAYWLYNVSRFFSVLAHYVPMFHLIKYAMTMGISSSTASIMLAVWSGSNFIGRLGFGIFASKYRSKVPITYQIVLFMTSLVCAAAFFAETAWSLFLYCFIYGVCEGAIVGIASILTIDLTCLRDLGAAWGIQQTINGIPTIAGPVLIGAMNDANLFRPNFMFIFTGGTFLVSTVFMHLARTIHNRRNKISKEEEHQSQIE